MGCQKNVQGKLAQMHLNGKTTLFSGYSLCHQNGSERKPLQYQKSRSDYSKKHWWETLYCLILRPGDVLFASTFTHNHFEY